MKNLFEHTSAPWIRYSSYEYKSGSDNNLYITVSKDAKPEMYHPMQEAEQLVIDAINVGLTAMHKVPEKELKEAVLGFIKKYGFLGFMTALPTTADFITYESVYLPKNHFIKEESLPQTVRKLLFLIFRSHHLVVIHIIYYYILWFRLPNF